MLITSFYQQVLCGIIASISAAAIFAGVTFHSYLHICCHLFIFFWRIIFKLLNKFLVLDFYGESNIEHFSYQTFSFTTRLTNRSPRNLLVSEYYTKENGNWILIHVYYIYTHIRICKKDIMLNRSDSKIRSIYINYCLRRK